jgi:hypothetical protein
MPIDFSRYVNLSVFDQEPTDIYTNALEYARIAYPELVIRQGTPEDAVLQAVSYISSLNIASINRLPDRVLLGILSILGAPADEGEYPVIRITFTSLNYEGAVIPAGTLVRYDLAGLTPAISIYFQTVEDLVIDAIDGSMSPPLPYASVDARCMQVMSIPNIPAGVELTIESVISGILPPVLESISTNGRYAETAEQYTARAETYLSSLTSAFGKASQIDAYIDSVFINVGRSKTYDLTNSEISTDFGDPDVPGSITIFTYGIGKMLTSDEKYEVLTSVSDRAIAGLNIKVVDAYIVDIEMSISVLVDPSFDSGILISNVKNIISQSLNPSAASFDSKLRKSTVATIASNVYGVVHVDSVTFISISPLLGEINIDGDIDFASKGTLPYIAPESITVTTTAVV